MNNNNTNKSLVKNFSAYESTKHKKVMVFNPSCGNKFYGIREGEKLQIKVTRKINDNEMMLVDVGHGKPVLAYVYDNFGDICLIGSNGTKVFKKQDIRICGVVTGVIRSPQKFTELEVLNEN